MKKYIVERDGIDNCLNDHNWTPYIYSLKLYRITPGDVMFPIPFLPKLFSGIGCDVNGGEFILLFIGIDDCPPSIGGIGLGCELGWNGT